LHAGLILRCSILFHESTISIPFDLIAPLPGNRRNSMRARARLAAISSLSLIAEFIAARSERAGLKIHCLQLLEKERQAVPPPVPFPRPRPSITVRSTPRRRANYPRARARRPAIQLSAARGIRKFDREGAPVPRLSRVRNTRPASLELAGSPRGMILARARACARRVRVADELRDTRLRAYVCMIATDRCISLAMHLRACWTSFAETLMDKRGLYGRREGARRGRLHIYVMTPLHST